MSSNKLFTIALLSLRSEAVSTPASGILWHSDFEGVTSSAKSQDEKAFAELLEGDRYVPSRVVAMIDAWSSMSSDSGQTYKGAWQDVVVELTAELEDGHRRSSLRLTKQLLEMGAPLNCLGLVHDRLERDDVDGAEEALEAELESRRAFKAQRDAGEALGELVAEYPKESAYVAGFAAVVALAFKAYEALSKRA